MIVKRVFIAIVALLLVPLSGCGAPNTNDGDIVQIDLATLTGLMDDAAGHPSRLALVDPRPASDYAAGHIPGAVNLRLPDIGEKLPKPPSIKGRKTIVVYGDDPGSAVAKGMTKKLMWLQYKGVRMFAGGMKAWRGAGMKVEGSAGK